MSGITVTGKKRVGLIRVLTTTDLTFLNMHGEMIMKAFPNFEVVSACIPDQPEGVHDEETEIVAAPKVLALAKKMVEDGMQAVIVSCAGDPGVELASAELSIPVIGAGRSAAAVALSLGRPVGVLGLTQKVPVEMRRALGGLMTAAVVPEGVVSTLDLLKPRGMDSVIEAGYALKARGAKVIVLACTGLATIKAAEKLRSVLAMPVVDPVQAEGAVVWASLNQEGTL